LDRPRQGLRATERTCAVSLVDTDVCEVLPEGAVGTDVPALELG
jgi:hypothetical protein